MSNAFHYSTHQNTIHFHFPNVKWAVCSASILSPWLVSCCLYCHGVFLSFYLKITHYIAMENNLLCLFSQDSLIILSSWGKLNRMIATINSVEILMAFIIKHRPFNIISIHLKSVYIKSYAMKTEEKRKTQQKRTPPTTTNTECCLVAVFAFSSFIHKIFWIVRNEFDLNKVVSVVTEIAINVYRWCCFISLVYTFCSMYALRNLQTYTNTHMHICAHAIFDHFHW